MSESDDEAFPNAVLVQLFYNAFALPNPAPELLNLLKTHPTDSAANDLVKIYIVFAEEHLSRAHELTAALASVRDFPDRPIFPNGDLSDKIVEYLGDYLEEGLDLSISERAFGPADTFLIASLLSGMSLKYSLTELASQYGNIEDGLNTSEDGYKSATAEVMLVGACIQLLIAGSEIMPNAMLYSYFESAEDVANKLNAQKSAGTLKNPNARKLLELAISHAETGLKRENDMDNVWQILFPS